ncbi:MAG: hypothetical protein JWL86_363 [Rhizobium sp.]|nr:hypothetical protein [Rhizobium sp.]
MDKLQAPSLDRQEIAAVITDWALCRDTGRWDRLRSLYAPGATMQTTWFDGPAEEFIDRSVTSFGGKVRAQHSIGVSTIDVEGDRATAETRVVLLIRTPLDAVMVDVTCYGRFYDFFVRVDEAWRIQKRIPVYEKDCINAVDPTVTLKLDRDLLETFAEGYRHLAYVQAQGGATMPQGLIEPQSEAERLLYEDGVSWLGH